MNGRCVKSSWIFCVGASLWLALVLAAPDRVTARKGKPRQPEELINVFLSPRLAQWLVGPISWIASEEEIASYLGLRDDAAAEEFVGEFWARLDADVVWPAKGRRQLFVERAEEADRLFREGSYLGRRTDRGTIHVLYGAPSEVLFEEANRPGNPLVEVWKYGKDSAPGLDGRKPKTFFRFIDRGDLTVFYNGATRRSLPGPGTVTRRD